jgi:hypothetical protein
VKDAESAMDRKWYYGHGAGREGILAFEATPITALVREAFPCLSGVVGTFRVSEKCETALSPSIRGEAKLMTPAVRLE